MIENSYLTDVPQEVAKYGFCKVLAVRREVIHIKHILTEVFIRKSIDIEAMLIKINYDLAKYMKVITQRLRNIHHFDRAFICNVDDIIKKDRRNFFPAIQLMEGLSNVIVLDFDGVVTEKKFEQLYELCLSRCKTVICSANPTITIEWFDKRELNHPNRIYSMKGKVKKINRLIELAKKHDNVFYVDNEEEYLKYAWLFGIKTFIYSNGVIKNYSLNSD